MAPPPLPLRRWLEFLTFYFALPLALCAVRDAFGQIVVPSLVLLGAVFAAILLRDPTFENRRLWSLAGADRQWAPMLTRLFVGGLALTLLILWLRPELFLDFAKQRPLLWLAVLFLYPIFSAYPQEILFRSFPFHRYGSLFRREEHLLVWTSVSFCLAHVFLWNWIAPVLSLLGGWIFARTYGRTRSTLQAAVEHGLWGGLLFTVGLGPFFYGGSH